MTKSTVLCSYGIPASFFSSATAVYRFPEPGNCLPLEPILSWVRNTWQALDADDRRAVSESIEWYLPQKQFFEHWLETGQMLRDDEVPFYPAEFDYERTALYSTLVHLTIALCNRAPQRWVWLDFRNACPSILQFCAILLTRSADGALQIIAETDGLRVWPVNRSDDPWYPFMEKLEANGLILPDERKETGSVTRTVTTPQETGQADSTEPRSVLQHCLLWYAWQDALSAWPSLSETEPLEWGLLLQKVGRFDEAVLYLNRIWEQRSRESLHRAALAGMALLRIHCEKKDYVSASQIMSILTDLLKGSRDDCLTMSFEAHLVYFWSGNGWPASSLERWEQICDHARRLGWKNTRGFLVALVPLFYQIIASRGFQSALNTALEAVAEAESMGNRYRVSVLFHVLGFLHERHGLPAEALYWFERCIAVRQELGDPVELIKVYNGTGYFSFSIGDFHKALNLYQNALELLKDRHDFTETCLTLFNIALINVFSGQHESALYFLDTILEVMDLLEYASLPWHRRSKILALAAYSAAHLGRRTLADHYIGSIRDDDVDDESRPYVCLARARVYRDSCWLDRGLASTDSSPAYLKIQYSAERVLIAGNERTELLPVSAETRALGLVMQADWLESLARGERSAGHSLPEAFLSLLSSLKLATRQEATARKLMATIGEITFVRQFQAALTAVDSPEKVLNTARLLWKTQLSPRTVRISRRSPRSIPETALVHRLRDGAESDVVIQLVPYEGRHFSVEDARLFALTADHLTVVWQLIAARRRLKKASTRDPLTGALNRAELFRQLDLERKRSSRGERRRPFSILFIDLDNFKYYNDTLSHHAGDVVLKQFCALIRTLLRDTDSLGRYGGDEFVILLPDTDSSGARLTAERLLAALACRDGFSRELKDAGFDPSAIRAGRQLGASIGFATWSESLSSAEELVQLADEKVYCAKARGKNRVEG